MWMPMAWKKCERSCFQSPSRQSIPVILSNSNLHAVIDTRSTCSSKRHLFHHLHATPQTRKKLLPMKNLPKRAAPHCQSTQTPNCQRGSLCSCFSRLLKTRSVLLAPPHRVMSSSRHQQTRSRSTGSTCATVCSTMTQTAPAWPYTTHQGVNSGCGGSQLKTESRLSNWPPHCWYLKGRGI